MKPTCKHLDQVARKFLFSKNLKDDKVSRFIDHSNYVQALVVDILNLLTNFLN